MLSDKSEFDITACKLDSEYLPSKSGDHTPDISVNGLDTESMPAAIQANSAALHDLSNSSDESDDNEQSIFDDNTARLSHTSTSDFSFWTNFTGSQFISCFNITSLRPTRILPNLSHHTSSVPDIF